MPESRPATAGGPARRPRPDVAQRAAGPGATSRPVRPAAAGTASRALRSRRLRRLVLVAIGFVVVVVLSAGVVAAAVGSRPVVYTASTQVLYGSGTSSNILGGTQDDGDIARALATQAQVVISDAITTDAAAALDLDRADLVADTKVTTVPESDVLVISVQAPDADEAVRRATVMTDRYLSVTRTRARQSLAVQADALEGPIQARRDAVLAAVQQNRPEAAAANREALSALLEQQSQLQAAAEAEQGPTELLAAASTPDSPSSLSTKTGAVAGAAAGLVLATGLLLIVVWWRRNPETSRD